MENRKKYFNKWSSIEEVQESFAPESYNPDFPTDEDMLIASYEYINHEGDGVVLFKKQDKIYFATGGHHSASDDFLHQWKPDEVSVAQLNLMKNPCRRHGDGANLAWDEIVSNLV
jgi:hypothetical protein